MEANSSARTRASIVLSVGSELPRRISAIVPLPKPDAVASERILDNPQSFMAVRVLAPSSCRASARAEFRTIRSADVRSITTATSISSYSDVIPVSGIPRVLSDSGPKLGANTRSHMEARP
jgi:hypothetical protein